MHKYILSFLLVLYAFVLGAQAPGQRPGNGPMPRIGRIYGRVLDTKKQPVEFAAVTLLAMNKDSVIGGGLARSNGDFSIDKLPIGRFRLRIQFIGYKTYFQNVSVSMAAIEQDLGNIRIEPDATVLQEVKVEGNKSNVTMSIDRRVYNVEKDLSTRGGSAVDVMKNVPGVTVDADGGVTLRNQSPTIFIDGRPTTLSLDQIPADQIERVEVITNPSAKYDAGATGGILNIVLKKSSKPGYNGTFGAGIGTNNRYSVNTNLNIKEKKTNFFLSFNLNTRGNNNRGFSNMSSLMNNEVVSSFKQNNLSKMNNLFLMGRTGFDYSLNNRNTVTVSESVNIGRFDITDDQSFSYRDSANVETSLGSRVNEQNNHWTNYTTQLAFRHTFPKKGKEFTTDMTYNRTDRNNNSTFTTYNFLGTGQPFPYNPELQKNIGSGSSDMFTFQFDFTNPLTDSSKLEWGAKSNYKRDHSLLNVSHFDYTQGGYSNDSILSNDYHISDNVSAAYVNYSSYLFGIAYQTGLRFEKTYFVTTIPAKNQTYEYIYPRGTNNLTKALFPSIYLSKKTKKLEAQLNFSRKINRPNYMQIMPFIMFSDKQNYRIGNPALAPEFINLGEANVNRIFKNGNFLSSVYIRQTENAITNFAYRLPQDSSSVLVSTFVNGKSSLSYGWENSVKYTFFKKLDLTLNGNIFYTTINASTGTTVLQNSGYSWFGKAIVNYRMPKSYTVQVNASYEAPKIVPQGTTKEVYSMDLSLSKDVKAFTFNATLSDVFNTRRWGAIYQTSTFNQDFSRRWDTRFFRVGFTWRFGETDASIFRRKPQQRRDPGQGGGEMEY